MKRNYILVLCLFISAYIHAQLTPPTEQQSYYTNVDFNNTGMDLFDDLAIETAAKHTNYLSYTPGIWEASKITDEDPVNSANVLLIYGYNDSDGNYITDRSRSKSSNGGTAGSDWNREHTFPNGLGSPNLNSNGTNVPPYADAHNLRPSDVTMNGNRGSLKFVDGSGNAQNISGGWYPGDEWKGDAARIVMYMYLRYGTQCKPQYVAIGTQNAIDADMINLLLEWNEEDPVSTFEDNRNVYHANASNTYGQGNRNPFIDNPYLATVIWGGPTATNRWGDTPPPDTEAPTTPIDLMASNITATTVDLSWTAATDNVGVVAYNIYVDGAYNVSTNSAATTITVTGLAQQTPYAFSVLAVDAANNASALSTAIKETTLESSGGANCVSETFANIPSNSSSYSDRTWTGDDGGTWNATRARTDQTLNGRALVFDGRGTSNGSLTSPQVAGGIGSLTASTQRAFSGGTGNLEVRVNNVKVGDLPYGDTMQTTTIDNINIEGAVTIVIAETTSGGDRVTIDDLTWACYTSLSVSERLHNEIKIYPNPISGDFFTIKTNETLNFKIINILGKVIKIGQVEPSKQTINISNLNEGLYILKLESGNQSISKKIIKL